MIKNEELIDGDETILGQLYRARFTIARAGLTGRISGDVALLSGRRSFSTTFVGEDLALLERLFDTMARSSIICDRDKRQ